MKGGTDGGSVATWTGQSWLLSDPIYGKVKVPARHVRKREESISWEGSPHLEGFPSSALTSRPGHLSVVGKKAVETPWKGRSAGSAARLHAAPRSTSHLGGWGPWLLRDTNRQQETHFPGIWFRLRLQHRVASADGCPLLPHSLPGWVLPFSRLSARACTWTPRPLGCYTTDSCGAHIVLLIEVTQTVNFSEALAITRRSKCLKSIWALGEGLLRDRFVTGNLSEPRVPKLPDVQLDTYIFSPVHLVNILLS